MTILASQSILPEFIKLRWQEPYVSAGLNRKTFKSLPRGVYSGFVVKPGPLGGQLEIAHDDPAGWGSTSGYAAGAFDMASGWSVAVHETTQGYNATIAIQSAPGLNYVFAVSGYAGSTVYPVLDLQYAQGFSTTAQIELVQAADLEANPQFMVLARVDVPSSGIVNSANIIYDDPLYPRILPFANMAKYGYMSPQQAESLSFLQSVSASPAFDYELTIQFDGAQEVDLPPGYTYVVGADDLWVFKNGRKSVKGSTRDYTEIDRGDGRGQSINWIGSSLRAGDRIELRIQQYAAVATSTTQILDGGALIEPNAIQVEFDGPGVTVLPNGPRRVKVMIPGGGGGGGSTKGKYNGSGSFIDIFRAVHLQPDNTMVYLDATNPVHKLYGVTIQTSIPGVVANVQSQGILAGAGLAPGVSGGTIGADVFVAQDGQGTLTTSFPNVSSGSIIRVGILDGADSVIGGQPTDIVFDRGRLA